MKKLSAILTLFFIQTSLAFAQPSSVASRLKTADDVINLVVCPVIRFFFAGLVILSTIMVIYAAYIYLLGAGAPDKITKANKTLMYAALGFVIALLAKYFPVIIGSILKAQISVPC